jgi:hypothetical protein
MSIGFYDIFEPEAETAPTASSEPRYRIEVVLDSRGRMVSAQADPRGRRPDRAPRARP